MWAILQFVYYSGYYFALFLSPWLVFYRRSEHSSKDWFYYFKLRHAKNAINNVQKNKREKTKRTGDKLDYKIDIPTKQHTSSNFIYGYDQKGNSLNIRFTLHFNNVAEVFLSLRLANGKKYLLPGNDEVKFYSVPQLQWKARGLNIEILNPFRKVRVTFNGLLKETSSDIASIEHVQFNFIWNAASAPSFFPEDYNTSLLSQGVANEHWRDGNWLNLLPNIKGYEQFGSLHGFYKLESGQETVINLPGFRTKIEGVKPNLTLNREVRIALAAEDGTVISLTLQQYKNGCSEFCYGQIYKADNFIYPITDKDLVLQEVGEHGSLPSMFKAHITSDKRVYHCVFHLNVNQAAKVRSNEENGYELYSVPCEIDLDTQQARGSVEFWYYKLGDGITTPPPLLTEAIVESLPEDLVADINGETAQILDLTGGKGNSLALMSSLDQSHFVVPGGFVVTTNAFKRQLKENLKLRKSVEILDDICCGREGGVLEVACKETIHTFETEQVIGEVKDAIIDGLKKAKQQSGGGDGERWAVRSSAIGEDSEDLSAAGQNETFLGCISDEDVIEAVRKCWASLFTFQSVQYRWQHGLPVKAEMAVVVQKMVPAEAAGVLFTCHPSTSNPSQMVVTSNYGLGESVVSAKSDPDTFILKKTYEGEISIIEKTVGKKAVLIQMGDDNGVQEQYLDEQKSSSLSLTDDQVLLLGEVGVYLENQFGGPRDIEWAFHKNRLYLLQSRPITTLNTWSDFELLHEYDSAVMTEQEYFTVANVGEVMPGALTVLSQTTAQVIANKAVQLALKENYQPYVMKCLQTAQHHVVINVINSIHRSIRAKIDTAAKVLDLAIFGHPVIDERMHQIALSRYPPNAIKNLVDYWNMIEMTWQCQKDAVKLQKLVADVKFDFNKKDVLEMHELITKAIDDLGSYCNAHCHTTTASVLYQMIALNVLMGSETDFSMDHYSDCALILSSCEDVVSAEIPVLLEDIALAIQEEGFSESFRNIDPKDGVEYLKNNCNKAYKLLQNFLTLHGHRLLGEFEIREEAWGTNPAKVIQMLQANCSVVITKKEKKMNTVDDVISKLVTVKSLIPKMILKFLISKMRVAVGFREKTKSEVIRGINKVRLAYSQFGDELVALGILPNKDLMYHLAHHELEQIIKKRNPLIISKAMRRQRLYPKWNKLRFEEVMRGVPEAEKEQELVYGKSDISCLGTPVCTGDVKARACVITSLTDIDQLQTGDVLITYSTDIGWSPYFPMLSAVITELGGLVSHGAVVAREYGLPCIVGVKNVTKIFKTGDVVQMSGSQGRIELVSREC